MKKTITQNSALPQFISKNLTKKILLRVHWKFLLHRKLNKELAANNMAKLTSLFRICSLTEYFLLFCKNQFYSEINNLHNYDSSRFWIFLRFSLISALVEKKTLPRNKKKLSASNFFQLITAFASHVIISSLYSICKLFTFSFFCSLFLLGFRSSSKEFRQRGLSFHRAY